MPGIIDQYNEASFSQNWEEVIRLKDDALQIIKAVGNEKSLAVYYIHLGIAYRNLGDLIKDIECQKTACRIYKSIDDENGQAYCYANLGGVYNELELYDDAIGLFNIAIELCKKTDDEPLFQSAFGGKAYAEQMIEATAKVRLDENGNKQRVKLIQTVNPLRKSRPYIRGKGLVADLSRRDKVFVSYSSKDHTLVKDIVNKLNNKKISTYFDIENKPTRDSHSIQIGLSQGLAESYAMLVCLSKNYLQSEWCRSEIMGFLLQSIIEGRGYNLPILVLDLDRQTPENSITFLLFGSLGVSLGLDSYMLAGVTPTLMHMMDEGTEIAEIFDDYHFNPEYASELIKKITLDTSQKDLGVGQIVEELATLKDKWEEITNSLSPSFSNIRDFYNIWDEQYSFFHPRASKQEKDTMVNNVVSMLPESMALPTFRNGEQLWGFIFANYKFKTIASTIEINNLLEKFKVPKEKLDDFQKRINRFYEPTLLRILEGIANNESQICVYDRSFGESTQYYRDLIKEVETGNKQLLPKILRGHPIQLIFGDAQRRNISVPLQYTYYYYLLNNPQNDIVDAAVLASLLITLDMWQDHIDTEEKFTKKIVEELQTCGDIWGAYHPDRYNNEVFREIFGKYNKPSMLVKDYKGKGPKIIEDENSVIDLKDLEPKESEQKQLKGLDKNSRWSNLKRRFNSVKDKQ